MAESMSLSPTLDPNSPYYIDPDYRYNEYLPMIKLSQAEADNYFLWNHHFLNFLRSKNKTGFVDGTIVKPEPSSPLYEPWEQCNASVKVWMMSSLSEDLRNYVRFAETAHKAWENLRMMFVPCVDLKIYQLRERIATLRQGGDSVGRYYSKLRRAWMELSDYDPLPECACGGCRCEIKERAKEAREKEQLFAFLMGLNNGLSFVRNQIMFMDPPPSLDRACGLAEQAESRMR